MGGLHDQVLHAVCHSAVQCLLHIVDLLAVACLHMVDDDLRGKSAAHAPVGVGGLQGVLNALDVGGAAVIEGGAEGHHQQLVLADLIGVAGIVLGSIAGVAAEVVGVSVLALHQLLLGIGQGVPCSLCGLALGIGVVGALLHIDGVDQVCHILRGQCVSVCAGSLAAGGRTGSNRACSAGSSPAAAGQYTGAQSQSGQSGRRFADVAFFHLAFPFLMWVKYGAEQKGTGKRRCKKRGLLLAKWQSKKTPYLTGFLVQPIPRDLGRQSPGTNSRQVS